MKAVNRVYRIRNPTTNTTPLIGGFILNIILLVAITLIVTGTSFGATSLFSTTIGTPIDCSNLQTDYLAILARANLPRIRFHDLRHTAASILLNNGVPVIAVSKMLGHSKVSVTMDIYGHLIPTMQEMATQVMADLVTPVEIHFENQPVTRGYADVLLKKQNHPYI